MSEKPIGFVVEGNSDKAVISSIMASVLPSRQAIVLISGGKATMRRSDEHVQELLHDGCEHVFVVFDRDRDELESLRAELSNVLQCAGIDQSLVTFVSPDPTIEAWLFPKAEWRKETPKRTVELRLQRGESFEELADKANYERIAKDDEQLGLLLAKLRSLESTRKVRRAGTPGARSRARP